MFLLPHTFSDFDLTDLYIVKYFGFHIITATWGDWGAWQSCNATCGNGTQIRAEECVNPDFTDVSCEGEPDIDLKTCNEGQCRKAFENDFYSYLEKYDFFTADNIVFCGPVHKPDRL